MKSFAFLPLGLLLIACGGRGDDSGQDESKLAPGVYAALGDSYSSGTGTREYYDEGCQRSNYAYGPLIAGERGYELQHVACSGAKIPDVEANQLSALSDATTLVTISIGGNDAGFSSVITKCAEPWPFTCGGEIDDARAFITDQLPGQLDTLYNDIRSRAPNAQVIVVGYPRLFNGEECNIARISPDEQNDLNGTADLLAETISNAATSHGFQFVDPREPFSGHAVCDDVEWVNGLSNPIGESYHPNRVGHTQYASLISELL